MKLFLSATVLVLASCATKAPIKDYQAFYDHQPTSILVVPVFNETTSAEAPGAFQSTIARPLIERGYYVFPVQPTAAILQSEGVFEGGQLREVPPSVFAEHLGTDAILYVTLHAWDTSYAVLASSVEVSMTYSLVDALSGELLWEDTGSRTINSSSSSSSGNIIADLLVAAVSAAVTAAGVEYVPLARDANKIALVSLPAGPLSAQFDAERGRYLAQAASQEEEKASEQP